jgi:hypothetical protein
MMAGMMAATTWGQPPVHYLQSGFEPPGSVASVQRLRGGPVAGYFQPVEIRGPKGSLVSIAHDGGFTSPESNQLHAALVVGELYRIRIGNIPLNEEAEVYPTIEMLNRLYPPEGQKLRFPIPIEITQEELQMAISGQLVTRVIYLENPQLAYPESQVGNEQRVTPIAPDADPLHEADLRGRPMVILRMGSRVPDTHHETGENLFPTPPFIVYSPPPLPSPMSRDEADRGLEREMEPRDYPRVPLTPTPEILPDSRREEDLPPIVSREDNNASRAGSIQSRLPQPNIQRR